MIGRVALALVAATVTVPVFAAEPVLLHAAGSLRSALTDVAGAYEAASGQKVQAKFGASGTLKNQIAAGERAEVFASANMEHPQALANCQKEQRRRPVRPQPAVRAGAAGPRRFASNPA